MSERVVFVSGSDADRNTSRPTMREVAALSGVSLKTVSRVINGESGVSAQLVDRVVEAARRLDYQQNLTASNLRRNGGKTRTIGLLLENVANPYESVLHRCIEEFARDRGVTVLAGSLDEDPERERDLALEFISRRVDGLIVMPAGGSDHSYLANERRSGTPMVFVDRPAVHLDADIVLTNNLLGSRQAVERLVSMGHRRIAFLGDMPSLFTATERFDGYQEALDRAGIPTEADLVRRGLRSSEQAQEAVEDMFSQRHVPTAIFASQNLVTIGAIRALHRMRLEHTVALIGFDQLPLVDLLSPGVTTVEQDVAAIGAAAAELLFRRLDGDRGPAVLRRFPTTLIPRGSGELGVSEAVEFSHRQRR